MLDWSAVSNLLTLALLGVGTFALKRFANASDATIKACAEEGVKQAFKDLNWSNELARELQKSRGLERQELRFRSYGTLWKELRPLAIYDTTRIDKRTAGKLLENMSNWYFSECGGLLLTPRARDFYFALQDLLRVTSSMPETWSASRSAVLEGETEHILGGVFQAKLPQVAPNDKEAASDRQPVTSKQALDVLKLFEEITPKNWPDQPLVIGKTWKRAINEVSAIWPELTESQKFAVLQQVGSKLRSALVNDLESREL
jgi:hypothetical protein